jgi:hypothetical protein
MAGVKEAMFYIRLTYTDVKDEKLEQYVSLF